MIIIIILLSLVVLVLIMTKKISEKFRNSQIIISLTTLPERLVSDHFYNVIQTLKNQELKADYICLHIPTNSKKYVIPEWVKKDSYIKINKTIENGPATKFLGLLDKRGLIDSDIIFICDDDIILTPNVLKDNINHYNQLKNKNVLLANAAIRQANFIEPEGFGGLLTNYSIIKKLKNEKIPSNCYSIDDTWLGFHLNKLNIPVIKTGIKFWNYQKSEDHPKWFELHLHTPRNELTEKCLLELNEK